MNINRQLALAAGLILLCWPLHSSSAQTEQKSEPKINKFAAQNERFHKLGAFKDKKINESSGVVVADAPSKPATAIWTFNDSGGQAELYRVGFDGYIEARLRVKKSENRDWESICDVTVDQRRFLAIGDVGDNLAKRKQVTVYLVPEPKLERISDSKGRVLLQKRFATAKAFDFTYEDGPRNCEAMAYDQSDHSYWFVEKIYADEKRKSSPGIYRLPDPFMVSPDSPDAPPENVAKRICDFPVRNVTGMAFSADGQKLVIRTYFGYYLFHKLAGKTWQKTMLAAKPQPQALPLQTQGEAVCFSPDGSSLLITSELAHAIIWKVTLDDSDSAADAKPKTENRKPKTENRKPKTENRKPKSNESLSGSPSVA